jgi:CHASE3 domain sensor protein
MVNINTSRYESSGGAPPAPGAEVGGAELRHVLAQDEFSSLWMTEPLEESMGETCIRVIPATIFYARDARKRIRTELAFWPRMRSDHVVNLYDYGWDHGYYYLLMQFMANGSLEHLLETGNTAGTTLPTFAMAFAEALREVHGAAGAHGCLKPSNVFFDNPKHVRLSDFAIPLWFDEAEHEDSPLRTHMLHPYRAPEQHSNPSEYTTRSDVYSYGLILLRCLSGEAPTLTGKRPRGYTVDWPAGLADVVPRCLAEDPIDRYEDGYQLYEELRAAMDTTEARRFYGENPLEDMGTDEREPEQPAEDEQRDVPPTDFEMSEPAPDQAQADEQGEAREPPAAQEETAPPEAQFTEDFDAEPEEMLAQARECIRGGNFDEALDLLEALPSDTPDIQDLLDEIEERQAECRRLTAEAVRLAEIGNPDAALETVREAERAWSGSSTLVAVKAELAQAAGKEEDEMPGIDSALEYALDNEDYNRARTLLEKELRQGGDSEQLRSAVRRFKHGRVRRAFMDNIRNARRLYALDHREEAMECWLEASRWLPPGEHKARLRSIARHARKGNLELNLRNVAAAAQQRADAEQKAREAAEAGKHSELAAAAKDLSPDQQERLDRVASKREQSAGKKPSMRKVWYLLIGTLVLLYLLFMAVWLIRRFG